MGTGATLLSLTLQIFLLGMIGVGIGGWSYALRQWRHGAPLIQRREPLPLVPWGLMDLLALAIILFVLQVAAMRFVGSRFGLSDKVAVNDLAAAEQTMVYGSLSLITLVWVVIAIAMQMLLRGASAGQLGCHLQHVKRDLRVGIVAFGMLGPLVYAIQVLLVRYWPSEHPFVKVLSEHPEARLLAIGAFAICVAAPVFEEFAFRVFFQGWLQNVAILLHKRRSTPVFSSSAADVHAQESEPDVASRDPWAVLDRPRQAPVKSAPQSSPTDSEVWDAIFLGPRSDTQSAEPRLRLWPIVASALVFALLHYSHGPDWVPLTVLALGLGYVYQRTGSVLPSIIVHMLLNTCSYAILLVQVLQAQAP